jgi:mono/diheme cytochrome c family protein
MSSKGTHPHSLQVIYFQRMIGRATWGILLATGLSLAQLRAQSATSPVLETTISKNCSGCHNDRLKTAGLSLTNVKSTEVAANAGTLEKVYRKIRAGEMPPASMPRLDHDTTTKLLTWLETSLDANAAAHPNPGAPAIHRLNRAEYRNAIRDLLGLETPDIGNDLPADDSGYGFDNIGDVLSVSPLHMERYISTGRRISRLATGTLKASVSVEKFNPPRSGDSSGRLPINERGGFMLTRYFPFDAEYSILVRGRGAAAPGMPAPKLDLRIDGKRVKLIDADMDTEEANQGTRNFELRVPLTAGKHEISAAMLAETARIESGRGGGASAANAAGIEYVAIGGPYNVKGPGETESRKRIFVCRPSATMPEEECARTILTGLAHRAYRRPVTGADIDPLIKLFKEGKHDGGDFDHGIEMALNGILVCPEFLYRVEQAPAGAKHGTNYSVSDLDLASRLSFFLWSSIPDEELLQLAEQKRLHDPAVMKAQMQRMLRDSKSRALVDNFAGQWLQLRNVADWKPDPDKFPGVDDSLRYAFQQETELFFENLIRENRSILELIDADYTFLNERLAKYYGIPFVDGNYFRKVDLSGGARGGVLTQGSILMVTSYPTRTSPVLRGKWVLENILGSPPPPPPPDVPPLSDDAQISAKSLRELLAKHRASATCSACHSRLDPLGFSLENFDAAGKFRSTEGGETIEASGSMPDGTLLDGPRGLKDVVLQRKDEFVECFAEKLLTYGLGRGLEDYDRPAVREIRRKAAQDGYRFEGIVQAIVDSVPFQLRRAP